MQQHTSRLQATEDFYRLQFECNPNPMWLYDSKTLQFLDVNEAAIAHYGYSRDEFLSMTIRDIRPAEDLKKLDAALQNKNFDFKNSSPWRHIKKNGEIIYMSISAWSLRYHDRQIVFAQLIDITDNIKQEAENKFINQVLEQKVQERTQQYHHINHELKLSNEELKSLNERLLSANEKLSDANRIIEQQAQMLLQQSEEKLNQILNVIQNVVWSVDINTGQLNYINRAALKVSGYNAEDFYANSKLLYDIILQEDKPIMKEALARLQHENYAEAEYRISHQSGGIRWVTNRIWLIRDKQTGEPLQMHGVVSDTTERKNAEEQIKENAAALKETQEVARIGGWSFDVETLKITWSDEVFRMYGLDIVQGPPSFNELLQLYYPEDLPLLLDVVKRAIEEAEPFNVDLRIKSLPDRVTYVNIKGKAVKDASGKVVKLYGTMLDINERKLFEQNLQEQNQQLIKINEELDRFVYSVSHNLRAPLTSVLGLINLIKISGEDTKVGNYLKLMEKSIHKLDETIHEINDYSRNARLEINSCQIDFTKIIREVIENHQYIEGAEKISIVPDLQLNHSFFSDESRLKVIFNNLFSNAIKYHDLSKPDPYIHITVRVSALEAIIVFKDNGTGIQADVVDKIFTMFFRGSEKSTGSGLGLYIVKETVVKLKGTISVASVLNEGSTFTIHLPNLSPVEV